MSKRPSSIFWPRFQSTLLMRGATRTAWYLVLGLADFNPRSSCEERPPRLLTQSQVARKFQSTLLMRGATACFALTQRRAIFQSTLLMRGATSAIAIASSICKFQSTLLMRGATILVVSHLPRFNNFNPRSSCEERHSCPIVDFCDADISIHAPHARSDSSIGVTLAVLSDFNPRSSCEERHRA